MVNMFRIYEDLSSSMDVTAAKKITAALGALYDDLQNTATRQDMRDLQKIVGDLSVVQQRTEQRMEELAAAQERTEQRMGELTVAQERTEQRMEELAAAQQCTEQRMEELATAQQRTEQRVEELAISQKQLVVEHQETRRQLGGLSMTVGYQLENQAYNALPPLLSAEHGITVAERLDRVYVTDKTGQPIEVNIYGKALQEGREVMIIGESKAQLSQNDVDRFLKKKVKRLEGVFPEMFLVLVTHQISEPNVKAYAQRKGVAVYMSSWF